MQYKTVAALLFATAALAAPAPDTTSYPAIEIIYSDVPSSILTVLETAIPTTWIESIYNDPAFRSEEASDIMHGTYPAWYNSLPESVKDWGTSAAMAEASAYSSYMWSDVPHPTPLIGSGVGFSTSGVSSTPFSSTASASTSTATAVETTTKGGSSGPLSTSASGSGSGAGSTSTAGAPAATGGVAMSLAGAAGILGLALAL